MNIYIYIFALTHPIRGEWDNLELDTPSLMVSVRFERVVVIS